MKDHCFHVGDRIVTYNPRLSGPGGAIGTVVMGISVARPIVDFVYRGVYQRFGRSPNDEPDGSHRYRSRFRAQALGHLQSGQAAGRAIDGEALQA